MAIYCGKYLFEKSKPARVLDCDKTFMNMGVSARRAQIGEVRHGRCMLSLEGHGAASSTVICPVGIEANISIIGHSRTYFTNKGGQSRCYSNFSGCSEIEKRSLKQQEGEFIQPSKSPEVVQ